jgi:hypothetical protein
MRGPLGTSAMKSHETKSINLVEENP